MDKFKEIMKNVLEVFKKGSKRVLNKLKTMDKGKATIYALLTIGALTMLFPFYWMVISSLKTTSEINLASPTLFPKKIVWNNFQLAMANEDFPYFRLMFNTIFVGVVGTIFSLLTTILAAFAFSKLKFKGKGPLLTVLLATMMIPGEMFVLTNFIIIVKLDWLDTYEALIVPFIVSVFYIYLLNNTFKQIPNELYLSAKMDGASDFKYLMKIMVPIAKPTIISITILKVLGSWNAYIWPNLVTNDSAMRLITNGLRFAFMGEEGQRPDINLQMAASVLVTLPVLIVFITLKKYIMRGSGGAGVKG